MHAALQEYYKYRGLYNQSELNRMETESGTNAVKVTELQESMDVALEDISNFLHTQMDGSTAHRLAMQKVLKEEKEEMANVKVQPTPRPKMVLEATMVPSFASKPRTSTVVSAI